MTPDPEARDAGTLVRFTLARVLVIACRGAPRPRSPGCSSSSRSSPTSTRRRPFQHLTRLTLPDRASPQTLLLIGSDHRAGDAVQRRQHRHDDARPAGRELVDDQRAVDPARPGGPDSRGGDGTDKLNAAYSIGGPSLLIKTLKTAGVPRARGQPRPRRQLRRLRGARQRDRLRLHRRRPPLLQQHRADRLLEHRHPARLPEAVRDATRSRSCASATPTATSSATRASRTSSAGPRSQYSSRPAARQRDTLLKIFGANAQTDQDLHTTDG